MDFLERKKELESKIKKLDYYYFVILPKVRKEKLKKWPRWESKWVDPSIRATAMPSKTPTLRRQQPPTVRTTNDPYGMW